MNSLNGPEDSATLHLLSRADVNVTNGRKVFISPKFEIRHAALAGSVTSAGDRRRFEYWAVNSLMSGRNRP